LFELREGDPTGTIRIVPILIATLENVAELLRNLDLALSMPVRIAKMNLLDVAVHENQLFALGFVQHERFKRLKQ